MAEMGMMPEEADRERAETVRLIWDEETHRTVCMVTRVVSR